MTKNQELHIFGCTGPGEESKPADNAAEHEVDQAQRHIMMMRDGTAVGLRLPTSTPVTVFWHPTR